MLPNRLELLYYTSELHIVKSAYTNMEIVRYLAAAQLLLLLHITEAQSKAVPLRCKDLKRLNQPTGEYSIRVKKKIVKVWCEMALGTGGGGYTFIHPREFYKLTATEQQLLLKQIYKNKGDVLMRVRKSDGRQPYVILRQASFNRTTPIYVGINNHVGYKAPLNKATMINPFLYIGFIPQSQASNRGSLQGLNANGYECRFTNCDGNPNSYIALFPNLLERTPRSYNYAPDGWGTTGPCGCIRNNTRHNPSGHVMPEQYFMFTELHFGGCGCYGQTDAKSDVMLGSAIGFR